MGDGINEGFFAMHIALRQLPMLDWDSPLHARFRIRASHVMNTKLCCLNVRHQVA